MTKTAPLLLLFFLCSACGTILTSKIEGNKVQFSSKERIIPMAHKVNCGKQEAVLEIMDSLDELEEDAEPGFSLRYQKETRDSLWAFQLNSSIAEQITIQLSIYDEEGFELLCDYELDLKSKPYNNAVVVGCFEEGLYFARFENTSNSVGITAKFELRR